MSDSDSQLLASNWQCISQLFRSCTRMQVGQARCTGMSHRGSPRRVDG
jgi:hypothetical protein